MSIKARFNTFLGVYELQLYGNGINLVELIFLNSPTLSSSKKLQYSRRSVQKTPKSTCFETSDGFAINNSTATL